ncbi:hypothetical protein KP509_23G000400 [Ceratopteris richardii]|uniref:RING-type domain-containing protein n=1 Tax=Ceratopteris richardii TaxID=49495 RepID=A0A8T2RZ12_CERRI|nr:hypothetical protein KP509_23G000400 [Ceratopteris richardii]
MAAEMPRATPADLNAAQSLSARIQATLELYVQTLATKFGVLRSTHQQAVACFLMFCLQARSLHRYGATIEEVLCGLRRRKVPTSDLTYLQRVLGNERFILILSIRLQSRQKEAFRNYIGKQVVSVDLYGLLQTVYRGLLFSYQLLFMFKIIEFSSPSSHVKQWHTLRGFDFHKIQDELMTHRSSSSKARLPHFGLDILQLVTISHVFVNQYREWWMKEFDTLRKKKKDMPNQIYAYPLPPPPYSHKFKIENVGKARCFICGGEKRQPTLCMDCGYLFCKSCIDMSIQEGKYCPISNQIMRFKRKIADFKIEEGMLINVPSTLQSAHK